MCISLINNIILDYISIFDIEAAELEGVYAV